MKNSSRRSTRPISLVVLVILGLWLIYDLVQIVHHTAKFTPWGLFSAFVVFWLFSFLLADILEGDEE